MGKKDRWKMQDVGPCWICGRRITASDIHDKPPRVKKLKTPAGWRFVCCSHSGVDCRQS